MKIVCDCGTEAELVEESERMDENNSTYAKLDPSKFSIVSGHDIAWITCVKCGKSHYLFT